MDQLHAEDAARSVGREHRQLQEHVQKGAGWVQSTTQPEVDSQVT